MCDVALNLCIDYLTLWTSVGVFLGHPDSDPVKMGPVLDPVFLGQSDPDPVKMGPEPPHCYEPWYPEGSSTNDISFQCLLSTRFR